METLKADGIYSTEETRTGQTWIDGQPIYRKVVRTGRLAGAIKTIAHGIAGMGTVVRLYGVATVQMGDGRLLRVGLPRVASSNDTATTDIRVHLVSLSVDGANVSVSPGSSAKFDDSFVVVEYTKQ